MDNGKRIYSLDLLRGLVMIIMALDHTRDFIHFDAYVHNPLDLTTTSPYLFFTRWITHFCAPVFVFLAGVSIFLQSLRKSDSQLGAFLLKRGLWLILIELTILNFGIIGSASFPLIVFQVIWTIGICMVLMSLIIRLPYKLISALGLIIVFGHNALDYIEATHHGFFWDLVHNGNFASYPLPTGRSLVIIYPFLPWLGLMMLGYALGKIYTPEFAAQRKRILIRSGSAVILFFIVLRFTNAYGNPFKWEHQGSPVFTFLSFINLHKYPPSLLYMCMTIGPALIFLALFENSNTKLSRAISVYGRVPFFYYIIHFYLIHLVSALFFLSRGHSLTEQTPPIFGIPFSYLIAGEGLSLTLTYVVWICIVLSLYPLCKWFSEYKKKHDQWWLSYL